MDLLTQEDRDEIRAVLSEVTTDTFCKTPVLFKSKKIAKDRWGKGEATEYNERTILCYVEYPNLEINDGVPQSSGMSEPFDVKVMMNVEVAEIHGLFTLPNTVNLKSSSDLFVVDGETYRVEDWRTDGNFEHRSILLYVSGTKIAKNA
jgi:hypothetical protein